MIKVGQESKKLRLWCETLDITDKETTLSLIANKEVELTELGIIDKKAIQHHLNSVKKRII